MQVDLIAVTYPIDKEGVPEDILVHAGRVCYRSDTQGNPGKFLQARIRDGHDSIVEHASATFEISGISRACSHQLVRHRIASFSQESQRYVDMSNPELVIPQSIKDNLQALRVWEELYEYVTNSYRILRDLGIHKEDARFILPNATATRIVVTMNFRELRHLFKIRISPYAQWEIREMCICMLKLIYPVAPNVFRDLHDELIVGNS